MTAGPLAVRLRSEWKQVHISLTTTPSHEEEIHELGVLILSKQPFYPAYPILSTICTKPEKREGGKVQSSKDQMDEWYFA